MTREKAITILKQHHRWTGEPKEIIDVRKENKALDMAIQALEQEPKTGHCKDCKWWKDSDGVFRRGIRAESKCPINRKEVFEGNGYCYMFEPQESEDKSDV